MRWLESTATTTFTKWKKNLFCSASQTSSIKHAVKQHILSNKNSAIVDIATQSCTDWPFSVFFNALFLSNLWEYHHKSYIAKTRFFWTTFPSSRVYGSNFNHCDVIGPKCPDFSKIMQNNGHYAVQVGFLSIRRYRDIDRGCGNPTIIVAPRYRTIS